MNIINNSNAIKMKENNTIQNKKNPQVSFKRNIPTDVYEKTPSKTDIKTLKDKFDGCIIGGAIGDAFGIPVEFKKMKKITKLYGEKGLRELIVDENTRKAKFSDDTQMTLFTIDGIIKSFLKFGYLQIDEPTLFKSYRDWFETCALGKKVKKGWISDIEEIRGTRGSGKTIMKTLSSDEYGTLENPINDSSGSGGVMRSAPFGLIHYDDPENAFNTAMKCTITTHGHPNAYLSAGVYSAIIANLVQGKDLNESIDIATKILKSKNEYQKVLSKIELAKNLAKSDIEPRDAIESIGLGWQGDGAIADAIYCTLKTPDDFIETIINAVNHSGDSDTVASIAGGIMGTKIGFENIPKTLYEKINLNEELLQASQDLLDIKNQNFNREDLYLID